MPTNFGITYDQVLGLYKHNGAYPTSSAPAEDWQLDAGHFVSAKQSMQQIYPRPDVETSQYAYHRTAVPGDQYEIPIGVGFGAYPFYSRIMQGPAGATIGQQYWDTDYLVLKWTPELSDVGAVNFIVRVTDQDLNYIDIAWSVNVSTTARVYADITDGSDSTGDGTLTNPYQTLPAALTNASGRPVGLFAGTYDAIANGLAFGGDTIALFGVEDGVSMDCSTVTSTYGAIRFNVSDCSICNLRMYNLQNTADDMRYCYSSLVVHRFTQYKVHFDGGAIGTDGTDNCSCMFLQAAYDAQRQNLMQSHCRFTDLPYADNGFSSFDLYEVTGFLHQFNTYDGDSATKSRYCAWVKAWSLYDICIQGNETLTDWDNSFLAIAGTENQARIEVRYNKFKNSYAASPSQNHPLCDIAYNYVRPGTIGITRGPIWFYRNTFYGEPIIKQYSENYPLIVSFENDVIVHNQTFSGATHKVMMYDNNDPGSVRRDPATREDITLTISGTECHGDTADNIVDSSLDLTAGYSQYVGTRGAQIT